MKKKEQPSSIRMEYIPATVSSMSLGTVRAFLSASDIGVLVEVEEGQNGFEGLPEGSDELVIK